MIKTSLQRLLLGLGMIFLFGCGDHPAGSRVSGSAKVRIPWKNAQGGVSLQVVELKGIHDLQEMKGDFARFAYAPRLKDGGIDGVAPKGQFARTTSGIYVPLDSTSQQMATIYAHMQALRDLDRQAGVGDLLKWPRSIGIATRIRGNDGRLWTDNAFYDGATDSILMVSNRKGRWPLSLNPGVIAHEHFHALFYAQVLGPLLNEKVLNHTISGSAHAEEEVLNHFRIAQSGEGLVGTEKSSREPRGRDLELDQKAYRSALVKMINEGLADVWGWIYSGQPDFIEKSFPNFKGIRSLKSEREVAGLVSAEKVDDLILLCQRSKSPNACANDVSYLAGSSLSRAVRSIFIGSLDELSASGKQARERLAQRLMKSLPGIADELRRSSIENRATLQSILQVVLDAEPLSTEEKEVSQSLLSMGEDSDRAGVQP